MLGWSRRRSQQREIGATDASSAILEPPTQVDDEALDTFVQVLRAFGRYAFDLDDEGALAFSRRDWATVVQFFIARRQREQQYVAQAIGDLRQGIWAFAQSLGTVLME